MKKLFRKILLSTFTIVTTFFIGNNVFAKDYKANIAVVGDGRTGKTQIIRRIFKEEFQEKFKRSLWWTNGVYGKRKTYEIGDDTFQCKYYDAPGYLKNQNVTLEEQIDSKAIKDANIALIVVDPHQKEGIDPQYTSSLQEAFARYVCHVRKVNPNCKIIIVANKLDTITDQAELGEHIKRMEAGKSLYSYCNADSIFISAKTGEGIYQLEEKIKNLLTLNKDKLQTGCYDFVECKCGHTKEGTARDCKRGFNDDLYCCEKCLREAEAENCSREGCTDKRRFLGIEGEGYMSTKTYKMYCSAKCYELAEIGESCSREGCTDERKFLRVKGEGYVSSHTGKIYCCEDCYIKGEGTYCNYKDCKEKFVVADYKGYVVSRKTDKKYCSEAHRKKAEDDCKIL